MNDIILQSCQEVFTGTSSARTETDGMTTNTATDDQTNNDNMTLRLEDEAIATNDEQIQQMLKRQRESMTPPNRNEKRKKDDNPAMTQTSRTN